MSMKWYNNTTKLFLERGYLKNNQSIEDKLVEMTLRSANLLDKNSLVKFDYEHYYNRLLYHFKEGNYVIPTPVWKNFYEGSKESPISCFGVSLSDSVESIMIKAAEVALQNKIGGGSSGTFEHIRGRGSKIGLEGNSNGSVSFMSIFQEVSDTISQPNRRGHFSATQDIEHLDADEFLNARTDGHKIQHISTGVKISDKFMYNLINKDEKSLNKIKKLIKSKFENGYPYIFFTDTVNRNKPQVYKDLNLEIKHSNMCQEICLPNSELETFVCNLLGMNVVKYDEWKDTDAVEIGIYFMHSMLLDFIEKMESKKIENEDYYNVLYKPAHTFVKNHMAMGMGESGHHSYLQSKLVPLDSFEGNLISLAISKQITREAINTSEKIAIEFGKANLLKDDKYKQAHTTLRAIAPNTSSSFIMGINHEGFIGVQSQSIEPYVSNYFIKDVAKLRISCKNPYLQKLLEEKGYNTEEVWLSILKNNGSVQHLEFLNDREKEVFKTFIEISQLKLIELAAKRQQCLDQSQSLNIMVGNDTPVDEVMYWILKAWKLGIKTLYYQLNVSSAQHFTNTKDNCEACAA